MFMQNSLPQQGQSPRSNTQPLPTGPGVWIELTPLIHIPVSCAEIRFEVIQALEEIHLSSFLYSSGQISEEFITVLNNPMLFEDTSNLDNLHPLVYFLAGLTRDTLSQIVKKLSYTTPLSIILNKVNGIEKIAGLQDKRKDFIMASYSSFSKLSGSSEFVSKLYDLVSGNEVFMVTTLIICTLNSFVRMFNPSAHSMHTTLATNPAAELPNAMHASSKQAVSTTNGLFDEMDYDEDEEFLDALNHLNMNDFVEEPTYSNFNPMSTSGAQDFANFPSPVAYQNTPVNNAGFGTQYSVNTTTNTSLTAPTIWNLDKSVSSPKPDPFSIWAKSSVQFKPTSIIPGFLDNEVQIPIMAHQSHAATTPHPPIALPSVTHKIQANLNGDDEEDEEDVFVEASIAETVAPKDADFSSAYQDLKSSLFENMEQLFQNKNIPAVRPPSIDSSTKKALISLNLQLKQEKVVPNVRKENDIRAQRERDVAVAQKVEKKETPKTRELPSTNKKEMAKTEQIKERQGEVSTTKSSQQPKGVIEKHEEVQPEESTEQRKHKEELNSKKMVVSEKSNGTPIDLSKERSNDGKKLRILKINSKQPSPPPPSEGSSGTTGEDQKSSGSKTRKSKVVPKKELRDVQFDGFTNKFRALKKEIFDSLDHITGSTYKYPESEQNPGGKEKMETSRMKGLKKEKTGGEKVSGSKTSRKEASPIYTENDDPRFNDVKKGNETSKTNVTKLASTNENKDTANMNSKKLLEISTNKPQNTSEISKVTKEDTSAQQNPLEKTKPASLENYSVPSSEFFHVARELEEDIANYNLKYGKALEVVSEQLANSEVKTDQVFDDAGVIRYVFSNTQTSSDNEIRKNVMHSLAEPLAKLEENNSLTDLQKLVARRRILFEVLEKRGLIDRSNPRFRTYIAQIQDADKIDDTELRLKEWGRITKEYTLGETKAQKEEEVENPPAVQDVCDDEELKNTKLLRTKISEVVTKYPKYSGAEKESKKVEQIAPDALPQGRNSKTVEEDELKSAKKQISGTEEMVLSVNQEENLDKKMIDVSSTKAALLNANEKEQNSLKVKKSTSQTGKSKPKYEDDTKHSADYENTVKNDANGVKSKSNSETQSKEPKSFLLAKDDDLIGECSFSEEYRQLQELFPTMTKGYLLKGLKSCNNNQEEFIHREVYGDEINDNKESEVVDSKDNQALEFLVALFPEADISILKQNLERNDNDFDKTYEMMSNAKALTNGKETIILPKKPKVQTQMQTQTGIANKPTNKGDVWNSINEVSSKIHELTNLPLDIIKSYLHKNKGKFLESLVDIIRNYQADNVGWKETTTIPKGGRVQYGQRTNVKTPVPKVPQDQKDEPYKYDPNSTEAKELRALYLGNKVFVERMSEKFFEDCLVFFKGDCMKVIEIALLLVENNAVDLSFGNTTSRKTTQDQILKQFQKGIKHDVHAPTLNVQVKPISGQSNPVSNHPGTIDLHGKTVKAAVDSVQAAVKSWWDFEVSKRVEDGRLNHFGSIAQFSKPLTIITGRGLHSTGGVAKIRPAVTKILARENYVFEESSSALVVMGKRINR